MAGKSSDADFAALRDRHEEQQAEGKRELAFRMMHPRERQFSADLLTFFRQARWIMVVRAFPDGKPMLEQTPWRLEMWNMFIQAIEARQSGAQIEPGD